ncbi:MAG: hypothetical protein OXH15_00550 [Gammaproteobacteria bacterium]|nr:hypothetical protein [Gammaproteobacteria bacterium]
MPKRPMLLPLALVLAGCATAPLKPSPIPPDSEAQSVQRLPVGANGTWEYPANAVQVQREAQSKDLLTEHPRKKSKRDERRRYRSKLVRSGSGR